MKIIKKTLTGFCVGVTVGMAFSIFFSKLYQISYVPSTPRFISEWGGLTNAVLASVILWGIIGIFWSLGGLIFRVQNWSALKRTVVHLVVSYCGFTPLALLSGWFPIRWIPDYTLIFIAAYVVIWTVSFLKTKSDVRKINQNLNARQS